MHDTTASALRKEKESLMFTKIIQNTNSPLSSDWRGRMYRQAIAAPPATGGQRRSFPEDGQSAWGRAGQQGLSKMSASVHIGQLYMKRWQNFVMFLRKNWLILRNRYRWYQNVTEKYLYQITNSLVAQPGGSAPLISNPATGHNPEPVSSICHPTTLLL